MALDQVRLYSSATQAHAARLLAQVSSGISDEGAEITQTIERAAVDLPHGVRRALSKALERLKGNYSEDEWGYDEEFVELIYPLFDFIYRHYWRVTTTGVHNLPSHGRAMLVANHAGILPWDATMMTIGIMKEHPLPRTPRFMVLNWAFQLPFISVVMRKIGGVAASPYNATRLLEQDHLVAVFPEGAKGTGKPFKERYRLQRFGRGGFVEIALRTGSPIIPVAVVGSEEIYPMIVNAAPLGRLIGSPYFPITPTFPWLGLLGTVPLPSRWRIEFCPPVDLSDYSPEAADDRNLVFEISEAVQEAIQEKIYENLVERGRAFAI